MGTIQDAMNYANIAGSRDELIMQWRNAAASLAAAKDHEMALRLQICRIGFNFSEDELREGTENLDLGNGYKVKAGFKINYSLNKEGLDPILSAWEKTKVGALIAERLIKWEPKLSVSEYRQLEPEMKAQIDAILTKKPATPSVEFVEPKSAK